jgi:hypothetical protein
MADALPVLKKLLKKCSAVSQVKTFGRRHTGYYATFPSGAKTYIVVRRNMQMYRGKEYCQTDALQKETATWMIDKEVLRVIRKEGVAHLLFFVKDVGDLYATTLDKWFDSTIAKDTVLKGWGEVRHLGVHHMKKTTFYTAKTLR